MRRDIVVANGQVNHVGEGLQVAISRGPILNDFDNTVQTLTDGIGEVSVRKGNCLEVLGAGAK